LNKVNLEKFRKIGLFEGVSFILLLFIAMPLKYMFGIPEATKIVGMAHGVLFLGYCYFLYICTKEYNWDRGLQVELFIASLLPFGTFITDKKLKKM
jgi:integral membrane protein